MELNFQIWYSKLVYTQVYRDYPIGQIVNMVGNQQNTNLVENGLL